MTTLKLVNIDPDDYDLAVNWAKHFITEWPERIGVRDGCGYRKWGKTMYVYRTKTMVIVRGCD